MWTELSNHLHPAAFDSAYVWNVLLKITALLVCGGLFTGLLRRQPAGSRHLAWVLIPGGTMAVPVAMWILPAWGIESSFDVAVTARLDKGVRVITSIAAVDTSRITEPGDRIRVGEVASGELKGIDKLSATGSPDSADELIPTEASADSSIASAMASEDWPQWGGNSLRNNVSSARNLPTTFDTDSGVNLLWKTRLGSVVHGGTVVSGDRILVGTNNDAGLLDRFPRTVDLGCLVCLDRKTGRLVWQHSSEKLATGRVHDWPLQGIFSTPCVEGQRLWYVTNRAEVVCLDLEGFADGENDGPFTEEEVAAEQEADVVWKLDMMAELGVTPHNVSVCSPTTDGTRLFIITGNGTDESHVAIPPDAPDVLCLDRATGKILWQDRPAGDRTLHASWSSPTYAVIQGHPMVFMGLGDGWVYAYDPAGDENGKPKLLWKFDANPKAAKWTLSGSHTRNPYIAIPVVWDNKLYIRTGRDPEHGDGSADLWCIDPARYLDGSDVSATVVYNGPIVSKPLGAQVPPRRLQNLDESAGEVEWPNEKSAVLWHFDSQDVNNDGKVEHDEQFHRGLSSPAIHDGLIFISDKAGYSFCLDAHTGHCYWTHDHFAACFSTPMIADGKVYVGNEDGDVRVFAASKTKQLLTEISVNNAIYCTLVACGNTMYVVDRNSISAVAAKADAAAAR